MVLECINSNNHDGLVFHIFVYDNRASFENALKDIPYDQKKCIALLYSGTNTYFSLAES